MRGRDGFLLSDGETRTSLNVDKEDPFNRNN